jgi:hypothetical protein
VIVGTPIVGRWASRRSKLGVLGLAVGHPEQPPGAVDREGDVVAVVERRGGAVERRCVEPPAR